MGIGSTKDFKAQDPCCHRSGGKVRSVVFFVSVKQNLCSGIVLKACGRRSAIYTQYSGHTNPILRSSDLKSSRQSILSHLHNLQTDIIIFSRPGRFHATTKQRSARLYFPKAVEDFSLNAPVRRRRTQNATSS